MGEKSLPARKGREVRGTETLQVESSRDTTREQVPLVRTPHPPRLLRRRYSLRKRRESSNQRIVAAISARGERTERSRVTWPKRGEPLNFSIRAAMPPNGEM